MRHPSTNHIRRVGWSVIAAMVLAALATGCEKPFLLHVGYAAPSKVWYHWLNPGGSHTIVVCDVLPDGSETNCRQTGL
jgi:hypothetical protein